MPVPMANDLVIRRAARHARKRLLGLTLVVVLGAGCATAPAARSGATGFDRDELALSRPATVVPGYFLGTATAQLAVIDRPDERTPRLTLYAHGTGGWREALRARLEPRLQFVGVARVGSSDRLFTFRDGRLSWFDPDAHRERIVLDVPLRFTGSSAQPPPRIDISEDLNGDGRADLVLPAPEGFWIALQTAARTFAPAVMIGPPEPFAAQTAHGDPRPYAQMGLTVQNAPWYRSRLHRVDYDRDGRVDLVFWNQGRLDVHRQQSDGRFATQARSFDPGVPFDADGAYSFAFGLDDAGVVELLVGGLRRTRRTVLHALRDATGDGVTDLITHTIEGRRIASQRSRFAVHPGTPTHEGIAFAATPAFAIEPHGRAGAMTPWGYATTRWQDLDADGHAELIFTDIDPRFRNMARAVLANSVAVDVEIRRSTGGRLSAVPAVRGRVAPRLKVLGRRAPFLPPILFGDVSGDGRADLVAGRSPELLEVFEGTDGAGLFSKTPREIAVPLPGDERRVRLFDLDGDAIDDIVIEHTAGDAPYRVITLIAL